MTSRRLFDATAVPHGPHGEFPRQLVENFDSLVKATNDLRKRLERVEAGDTTPVGYFPRKIVNNGSGDPYAISWDEIGYAFDDENCTADVYYQLPDSSTYPEDLRSRSVYFLFHVTQPTYFTYITCQGSDTINVDLADQSAAAGNVKLTAGNSAIALRLVSDGWRAFSWVGKFEIDAA